MVKRSKTADSSNDSLSDPIVKKRWRRIKANFRERNRMHDLNNAMDTLRQYVPLTMQHQKLSKIETLRLARTLEQCIISALLIAASDLVKKNKFRNYITVLNQILYYGKEPNALEYAQTLSNGMSQPTTNMIASLYNIQPRLLLISSNSNSNRNHQHETKKSEQKEIYEQNGMEQAAQYNHVHNYSSSSSETDSFNDLAAYHTPSYYPNTFVCDEFIKNACFN